MRPASHASPNRVCPPDCPAGVPWILTPDPGPGGWRDRQAHGLVLSMAVEKKMRDWEATALGGLADAYASGAAEGGEEEVVKFAAFLAENAARGGVERLDKAGVGQGTVPHLHKLLAGADISEWVETDIFLSVSNFEKMAAVAANMRRKVPMPRRPTLFPASRPQPQPRITCSIPMVRRWLRDLPGLGARGCVCVTDDAKMSGCVWVEAHLGKQQNQFHVGVMLGFYVWHVRLVVGGILGHTLCLK